jgi:hypothetical protein
MDLKHAAKLVLDHKRRGLVMIMIGRLTTRVLV